MGKQKNERPKIEVRCPIKLRIEFQRIVVEPTGLTAPEMIRAFMIESIRLQKRYNIDGPENKSASG